MNETHTLNLIADYVEAYHRKNVIENRPRFKAAYPLQEAWWVAFKTTFYSYSDMARVFEKDHKTIMHGVAAVDKRRYTHPAVFYRTELYLERFYPQGVTDAMRS